METDFVQRQHFRRALQQAHAEVDEPGIGARVAERGKPHLPIESRLMRRDERRSAIERAGFRTKRIFLPLDAIVAAAEGN